VFSIHEDTLTVHCDLTAATQQQGWKKNRAGVLQLPEENDENFDVFARFIYSGKVRFVSDSDKDENGQTSPDSDASCDRLMRCWLLGYRLQSVTFRDAVIDVLFENLDRASEAFLDTALFETAFQQTEGFNGLRKLAVDLAIDRWQQKDFVKAPCADIADFWKEVSLRLIRYRQDKRHEAAFQKRMSASKQQNCTYHDHLLTERPCYRKLF